jgi:hypothetical protein
VILWLAYKGGSGFAYTLRNIDDEPSPTIGGYGGGIGGSQSPHGIFLAPSREAAEIIMNTWLKGAS